MSNKMYLYGGGGISEIIAEIVHDNGGQVAGIFDDNPKEKNHVGGPVDQGLSHYGADYFQQFRHPFVVSIGNNRVRKMIAEQLPVSFGTAIHPSVLVSKHCKLGEGTIILQGSIVQANSVLGKHVLINTAATIDHDNILGDYVHVSPHAILCGHIHVGEGTHVGAGATIIQCIQIGKWCTIGAGAVVIRDVPDYSVVVGNPARVLKQNPPIES